MYIHTYMIAKCWCRITTECHSGDNLQFMGDWRPGYRQEKGDTYSKRKGAPSVNQTLE